MTASVTLCSIMRNSAHYLDRYLEQVTALRRRLEVRLVVTYGDCTDNTYGQLITSGVEMDLAECSHGGPNFGSIDHPTRWDQIAKVVRFTLDRVGDPGDALIWVEADLIWHPDVMLGLVTDLDHVPAVAPQLLANNSIRWYDTFSYRRNGEMFNGQPPYYQPPNYQSDQLVPIDSCGSCFVTDGDYWRDWSGHWPYTPDGGMWLDPALTVWHP